ncbi:protein kinase, ATP binding site-containing protein [Tanacetum coccineum]
MMPLIKTFEHLQIQLEAIKSATNNFDAANCIGSGGFGKVYKEELPHSKGKTMVALKRLDRIYGQGEAEFWKEVVMLSLYKHEKIVSLLGFCDDSKEKILVYEYVPKGSLDLYLEKDELNWATRLRICIGAARGLAYLHSSVGTQQRVLHRDVKSSNILLDDNWKARISDLGLSKFGPANQQFTFLVSHAVGTIGYCDPLYVETGLLTKESDVYSFGVVLFEVFCGRLCIGNDNNKHVPLTGLTHDHHQEENTITYDKSTTFYFMRARRERFGLEELQGARVEVLGKSILGATYKVFLSEGSVVVAKRFLPKVIKEGIKVDFHAHVMLLGSMSHPNLLPYEACNYDEDGLLITDFAVNGSMASHLHVALKDGDQPGLDWPTRLRIIQADYALAPIFKKHTVKEHMKAYKSPEFTQTKKTDVCTTTIGVFPSDISGFSPATCRWGNLSPATCRWGIVAGEYSSGIQSPAIIPSEDVGPTRFSVKQFVSRWQTFPQRHVAGDSLGLIKT